MGFSTFGAFDPLPARGWGNDLADVGLTSSGSDYDAPDEINGSFVGSPVSSLATGIDASYTNQFVDMRPALPYGRGAVDSAREATDARLRG